MPRRIRFAFFALVYAAFISPVTGQDNRISVDVALERMSGYTRYQIGGRGTLSDGSSSEYPRPLSELTFPLYVYLASVGFTAEFNEDFRITTRVKTNPFLKAGKMRDADWGVYYAYGWPEDDNGIELQGRTAARPDTLDILSLSDAELRSFIGMTDFLYFPVNGRVFQAGFGGAIAYYNLSYEVSNVDQWYPSSGYYFGTSFPHDGERRLGLTYKVEYYIPSFLAAAGLKIGKNFSALAQCSFSPYARVYDYDTHILRSKRTRGQFTGFTFGASLDARLYLSRAVFAGITANYLYLAARGEQKQYYFEDSGEYFIGSIDAWVRSEQMSGGIVLGYSFE